MKHKHLLSFLLICIAGYIHAQSINNILPMGNWVTSKQLDSLKVGDTLVMINATSIDEYELNFKREGKVTWYKQHSDVQRDNMGNNTFTVNNTWDVIGDWTVDNDQLTVFIDMAHKAPQENHQNCRKFVFKQVSASYQKVKLIATKVDVVGASK